MQEINGDRLLADLHELASFGSTSPGVHRLSLSPADLAARKWLRDKMLAAGLTARIDGVGNVYGSMPTAKRAIIVGSHTDTVPHGGWLDGSLGVIYGLEIARVLNDDPLHPDVGVDVISYVDEEATFSACLGSRSFFRSLAPGELAGIVSQSGVPLRAALEEAGLAGADLAHVDPSRHFACLECHIEQGPKLEATGTSIGIVTGIVGVQNRRIEFAGRADHAGGTPMSFRRDAGAALIRFAADLLSEFERHAGADTVWNIGNVKFEPGRASTVPERAWLQVQFRDQTLDVLDRFGSILSACLERHSCRGLVTVSDTTTYAQEPVLMDERLANAIEEAAAGCGASSMRMPSGAYHDSQISARHLPTGMLFVPSIGGRSHTPEEDTSEYDIVKGASVALASLRNIAKNHNNY